MFSRRNCKRSQACSTAIKSVCVCFDGAVYLLCLAILIVLSGWTEARDAHKSFIVLFNFIAFHGWFTWGISHRLQTMMMTPTYTHTSYSPRTDRCAVHTIQAKKFIASCRCFNLWFMTILGIPMNFWTFQLQRSDCWWNCLWKIEWIKGIG